MTKGHGDQAIGKVKEAAGKATGDRDLEAEGKGQNLGGKVRETADDAKQVGRKAIDTVTRRD